MARQGGGSANSVALTAAALLLCILVQFEIARAATFTVGDDKGWTFNLQDWPKGKTFKAGDELVFNYSPSLHNVVQIDSTGYNACNVTPGSKTFTSGKDTITLSEGHNYFICGVPTHCSLGQKIDVLAA